jgi:hypothetical protein
MQRGRNKLLKTSAHGNITGTECKFRNPELVEVHGEEVPEYMKNSSAEESDK